MGQLEDFIIDPRERRLTHLVVEEPDGHARLVPAEWLAVTGLAISLARPSADVHACESIRAFSLGPEKVGPEDEAWDMGIRETVVVPGMGGAELGGVDDYSEGYGFSCHRIPVGTAELGPESPVLAEGDEIAGTVDGLFVADGLVTHLVVRSAASHHATPLAVPIEAVASIETDKVFLRLASREVESLAVPDVDVFTR